jgi:hypothetical protein
MRRTSLVGLGCLCVGLSFGFLCRSERPDRSHAEPLGTGAVITIARPVGEPIVTPDGLQRRLEATELRVMKRQDESIRLSPSPDYWRVTIGGATYVCAPVE